MLTWFNTFLVLFLIQLIWFFLFVVSIQPAKLYTINLLVNNTEGEDIVLAPSDSRPANGFVLKGQTCKRLVKRLRIPSPVNFRVWGITTNKPFLLNGQREISITPSDYEQDLTEVSIKMVKPGGEFIMVITIWPVCCLGLMSAVAQFANKTCHKDNSRFDAITLLKFSLNPYSAISSTGITRHIGHHSLADRSPQKSLGQ